MSIENPATGFGPAIAQSAAQSVWPLRGDDFSVVDGTPGEVSRVRWLAMSVLVLAWLCHITTQTTVFPLLCALAALIPMISRKSHDLGPPTSAALLITVMFSLKLYFAPYQPTGIRTLLAFPLAHACGQGLMCWQIAALWTRKGEWLQYVPLAGVLVAMCWGDVELNSRDRPLFTLALLGMLACHAFAMGASTRRRHGVGYRSTWSRIAILAAVLLTTGAATAITSPLVGKFWRRFEEFLNSHFMDRGPIGQVGFSTQSHLGSVSLSKDYRSEQAVLRIESVEEPGYLRGAVFETLDGSVWQSDARWTMVTATSPGVSKTRQWEPAGDEGLFAIPSVPGDSETFDVRIWPEGATADRLLLPGDTDALITSHDRIQIDTAGIVAVVPGSDATLPYRVHLSHRIPEGPSREQTPELYEVSAVHREGLQKIADDLCWKGDTTREVVQRVEDYLRTRFRYSLSASIPARFDPLVHFLTESRAGHCEYFASAAVMLLRMQDIPARYVTGFLVDEFNPRAGNWIARRKDAHAWCEAWIPGEGWIVVDGTPVDGRSQPSTTSFWLGEWDAMQWLLRKARWEAAQNGWEGVRYWVQAFFLTTPGLILSGAFLLWFVTRVVWPALRSLRQKAGAGQQDRLTRMLETVEDRLVTLGLARGPAETIDQFALRVEGADPSRTSVELQSPLSIVAAWLRDYSAARYGAQQGAAEGELAERLKRLSLPGG